MGDRERGKDEKGEGERWRWETVRFSIDFIVKLSILKGELHP